MVLMVSTALWLLTAVAQLPFRSVKLIESVMASALHQ